MSVMDFIAIVSLLVGVFALGYMFGSKIIAQSLTTKAIILST